MATGHIQTLFPTDTVGEDGTAKLPPEPHLVPKASTPESKLSDEDDGVEIRNSLLRDLQETRTSKHCMLHSRPCRTCEGC